MLVCQVGLFAAMVAGPPPASGPPRPAADPPPVGTSYKPGAGLTVRSQDRRFALTVNLWGQLLAAVRHDATSSDGPATPLTLELRRARAVFSGNLFTPHIKYNLHLMFSPRDLAFKDGAPHRPPVFMYFLAFDRLRHANIHAGFFFVPFSGQRVRPPPWLQMIDVSNAIGEFTLDEDIGVQLSSTGLEGLAQLRYAAGVFIGDGYDYARAGDFGLMYVGRLDITPRGSPAELRETGQDRSPRPLLNLGTAYAFTDRDHRTRAINPAGFADGGTSSAHNLTADMNLRWSGLSLLTDVYVRRGWRQAGDLTDQDGAPLAVQAARNGFGWTIQGGMFVPRTPLELVARSSGVRPVWTVATSLARLDEAGLGFNYYFHGHAMKLQLDYIHTWGPALPATRSDQTRLQLQMTF